MSMPVSRLSTLLILSFAASSAAAQTLLATHGETVLAAGDPAPGVIGATMINTSAAIDSPVMDQNGALLFRGRMLGAVTGADDRAYFYGHSNGNLRLVARASDQAPGCLPGTLLRSSSPTAGSVGLQTPPKISPFGEFVLFRSKLYDPVTPANTPTTSDTGVFYGTVSGGLLLLAREGEQMPSLPAGVLWGEMDNGNLPTGQMYHVNAGGAVLFQTPLAGAVTTGDDAVMVTGSPGSLQIVSREGDVLPDGSIVSVQATTPTGSVTLGFTSQLNASGQVLHDMRFSITSGSATATNDRALALWSGGTNVIIAREGDAAPGTVGASFLDGTGWSPVASMLTRSGNTTLAAALSGGDVAGTTNNRALYFGGLAGWVMVMRKGDLAPGLAGGELFNVVNDSSIACNDSGQVAFLTSFVQAGSVTAANDTALWLGTAGNLTMMAREGDACVAAGLGGGPWTYADIGTGGTATPRLNDRGEMLWHQHPLATAVMDAHARLGLRQQPGGNADDDARRSRADHQPQLTGQQSEWRRRRAVLQQPGRLGLLVHGGSAGVRCVGARARRFADPEAGVDRGHARRQPELRHRLRRTARVQHLCAGRQPERHAPGHAVAPRTADDPAELRCLDPAVVEPRQLGRLHQLARLLGCQRPRRCQPEHAGWPRRAGQPNAAPCGRRARHQPGVDVRDRAGLRPLLLSQVAREAPCLRS
jgi:hypothetical protein